MGQGELDPARAGILAPGSRELRDGDRRRDRRAVRRRWKHLARNAARRHLGLERHDVDAPAAIDHPERARRSGDGVARAPSASRRRFRAARLVVVGEGAAMRPMVAARIEMTLLALGLGCIDVSAIPPPDPQALQWREPARSLLPSGRSGHAMATLGDKVVLFGGSSMGGLLADTWEWDGGTWTQRFPAAHPPPRANHSMTTLGN